MGARELERMRESALIHVAKSREKERLERLKELSDEKVRTWPNTLEAMRLKKENWKKEKLEEEEKKRIDVDQKEAALQRERRKAAIERAEKILYDRTDEMKTLRSQMSYSEVVHERRGQIQQKVQNQKEEKRKDLEYHDFLMGQLKISEDRDTVALEATKVKAEAIAKAQRKQLDEYRDRYMERLRIAKREGELVLERAIADAEEEKRVSRERILKEKDHVRKSLLANDELQLVRAKQKELEAQDDVARKAVVKKKEEIAVERKRLEKARFDARQATKQRLIDRAAHALEMKLNTEAAKLEKEVEEQRKKEEDRFAKKQALIAEQKAAIDVSRKQQLDAKQKVIEQDQKEISDLVEQWKVKNIEIENEEANDAIDRRNQNLRLREAQLIQIHENREKKLLTKESELQWDRHVKTQLKLHQERFQRTAADVIDTAKTQGKPIFMLEKARLAKDTTIQPASGIRV